MIHFEHTINLRWVCHLRLMVNFSMLDPCLLWVIDPNEKCHKGSWFGILKSLSWFLRSFAFVLRLHISCGVKITRVQQLSSRMPRPAFCRGMFTSRERTLQMWYLEMPGTKWFQITDFLQALVKGGQQMRIGNKCLSISMRVLLLILLGCHCSLIATFSFKQAPNNGVTGKHILESSKHHLRFSVPAIPFVTKKGKYPTISAPQNITVIVTITFFVKKKFKNLKKGKYQELCIFLKYIKNLTWIHIYK